MVLLRTLLWLREEVQKIKQEQLKTIDFHGLLMREMVYFRRKKYAKHSHHRNIAYYSPEVDIS